MATSQEQCYYSGNNSRTMGGAAALNVYHIAVGSNVEYHYCGCEYRKTGAPGAAALPKRVCDLRRIQPMPQLPPIPGAVWGVAITSKTDGAGVLFLSCFVGKSQRVY